MELEEINEDILWTVSMSFKSNECPYFPVVGSNVALLQISPGRLAFYTRPTTKELLEEKGKCYQVQCIDQTMVSPQ